jgi:hypothetical protein
VASDAPLLTAVTAHFDVAPPVATGFHPMTVAEHLLTGKVRSHKLPGIEEALTRFERLFADLA